MTAHEISRLFLELGAALLGLAILARIASRWSFPAIPLYLLAGLAFGKGGIAPLDLSQNFIHIGAEIGVLLLLFMLGLEYSGNELKESLRANFPSGLVDLLLNFPVGLAAGLLLGWKPLAAVLLGGVTYISSSGIVARILSDLRRLDRPETSCILSVLVIEDLAMAIFLPIIGVLLSGGGPEEMIRSISIAVVAVMVILLIAIRYGDALSRISAHESDEIVLLTTFGTVLLIAGAAERFNVSSAIGAFLAGIAVSGPIHEQAHRLLTPLRDLFAAIFFFFFGLEIDPATLPPVIPLAALLAVISGLTKIGTGYWAARSASSATRARIAAGIALISRGEFSIVIAGLGLDIEPGLGPVSAAYVLIMAILGPLLARLIG